MMYNKNMAAAIKVNGKTLREFNDTVYVPFGAEYSIYLKNLNTKKAIVHISIDGKDVDNGAGFVIYGNSTLDLERFVSDMSEGNRFKFIERTSEIEKHRGVGIEDGLIRIEYQYEAEVRWRHPTEWPNWSKPDYPPYPFLNNTLITSTYSGPVKGISTRGMGSKGSSIGGAMPTSNYVEPLSDAGITVPGSISDQKFQTVASFPLESEKHVMVIKMLGETARGPVIKEVTTKFKPRCVTCNKLNKANAKFCAHCGTSLNVIA